jgi:hypothetical protein
LALEINEKTFEEARKFAYTLRDHMKKEFNDIDISNEEIELIIELMKCQDKLMEKDTAEQREEVATFTWITAWSLMSIEQKRELVRRSGR